MFDGLRQQLYTLEFRAIETAVQIATYASRLCVDTSRKFELRHADRTQRFAKLRGNTQ